MIIEKYFNFFIFIWLIYVTYINICKLYVYINKDSLLYKFSNGKPISFPGYVLYFHTITLYLIQAYLSIRPYLKNILPYEVFIVGLLILINYILIIPHSNYLGNLDKYVAIIINNVFMIILLILSFF